MSRPSEPVCPTCGRALRRTITAPTSRVTRRRMKRSGKWTFRRTPPRGFYSPARRTYATCADPWHDVIAPPAPPRGRIGHNDDIGKLKRQLSRALQGKDRR